MFHVKQKKSDKSDFFENSEVCKQPFLQRNTPALLAQNSILCERADAPKHKRGSPFSGLPRKSTGCICSVSRETFNSHLLLLHQIFYPPFTFKMVKRKCQLYNLFYHHNHIYLFNGKFKNQSRNKNTRNSHKPH